ncbi:amino acid permease, partial [Mobilicoccus pelagius]
ADVIAVAGYGNFWVNADTPGQMSMTAILLSVVTFVVLLGLNLLTVKFFGEIEFWFAIIKIVAIVALIVMGVTLVLIGFTSPEGTRASFSHLWARPGGIFPTGMSGFFAGFQIAVFAFVGIELVGTTAAETADPERTLPKAINSIPIRVVLFYVLSLAVIMMVTPWDEVDPAVSPFVNMFALAGIVGAASIMNFVVLTSAASSANSGIFSTSRMLYGLAHRMPGGVVMCWVVLAFFLFVLVLLTQEADTRQALPVTPLWFLLLGAGWVGVRGKVRDDDTTTMGIQDR